MSKRKDRVTYAEEEADTCIFPSLAIYVPSIEQIEEATISPTPPHYSPAKHAGYTNPRQN